MKDNGAHLADTDTESEVDYQGPDLTVSGVQ